MACVPQDDLSSYAQGTRMGTGSVFSASEGGASAPGSENAEAQASSGAPNVASPSEDSASRPPDLDAPGSEPAAAGAEPRVALDAGRPAEGTEDGGTPDAAGAAAPLLDLCTSQQGILEPGTRNCLFVSTGAPLSWLGAQAACASRDADLVAIQSRARDDFLAQLISDDIWTGGRDATFFTNPGQADSTENQFTWVLDETPVAPLNFASMEPDGIANQFCIAKTVEPGGPWRDRPCTELKAFVCETAL